MYTIPDVVSWFQAVQWSVYEAVATFFVLPTTASFERSFSGLRRIKTYLRSSMGQ
jgi:hypothetical protein